MLGKILAAPVRLLNVGPRVVEAVADAAFGDGIGMHLDCVGAVFEFVILGNRLIWQFAFLAHRNETTTEPICDSTTKNEPARLDAGDGIHRLCPIGLRKACNGCLEALRVGKKGRDVAKHNAWLWIVRDGSDEVFQVVHWFILP